MPENVWVNHTNRAPVVNEAMQIPWPDGVKFDNVLLSSDVATHMEKAADAPYMSCSKRIHVTCIASALRRVCETIRVLYPNGETLVADGNKISVE
jgi:hypothetical protein